MLSAYIPIILVVLVALLGGGISPFSKIALFEISAPLFIALRFIVAGLLITPAFLIKKEHISRPILVKTLLISVLAILNVTFFALGIKRSSATVAQIMYATVPIIVTIISAFLFKKTLNRQKVIGILTGFAGVLIIILAPLLFGRVNGHNTLFGNLLVLIAIVSYSFYTVLSKPLQKEISPMSITTIFILMTIIVQGTLAVLTTPNITATVTSLSLMTLLSILYVGALGSVGFFLLYQYTIKKADPITTTMVFYLQPVFTFIWSMFLLDEKLAPQYLIGGLVAFVGAYLVTKN